MLRAGIVVAEVIEAKNTKSRSYLVRQDASTSSLPPPTVNCNIDSFKMLLLSKIMAMLKYLLWVYKDIES